MKILSIIVFVAIVINYVAAEFESPMTEDEEYELVLTID
jgi:hypothetical protein